jgi:protoheme IX farnesyltransferase
MDNDLNIKIRAYCTLTKPRIIFMVLLTTAFGFVAASDSSINYLHLVLTLVGTALSGGGAAAINHYLERDLDALMRRTADRPLPMGVLQPSDALYFGLLLVLLGVAILAFFVNILTAFLALLTAFLYTLVYTPLKRRTWLNTAIGAIPGALPPMGGWAGASDNLELGAWILFAILFLWQHPHFYSLAWLYREDYARADLKMLPVIDVTGLRTFRQIIFFSLLLLVASLLPYYYGFSGLLYFTGAMALGLWITYLGIKLIQQKTAPAARKLFAASLVYLPGLFVFVLADQLLL